ncbi:DMT family transporter [Ruegeria arenilitoris]|uniref:DMT family transporter n=2 Tax=Ruegeria arenilitoris TaxID=1173585 RepID=UPI0020C4A746|nr:DMT family transporter [Ruegeria arenilitoris]
MGTNTPATHTDRPLAAAAYMICAMAIIGVIDNFIAPLSQHIGLWQFHLIRTLFALPLVAMFSLLGLGTLFPNRFWAVALRSLLVAISMLFYFSALAMMPIAQALAGLFTSPIFILLITSGIMKRRIGPWRVLAVGFGFIGIILVLQPNPADFDWSIFVPICAGFFYALGAISTRSLCSGESTVALLAGMLITLGILGAIGSITLVIFPVWQPGDEVQFFSRPWEWSMQKALPLLLLQAVGSICGVFMIIKSYQLGEPSYVSVFEYSVMIFGPVFAWFSFGQPVQGWQILGIAFIALAGIIIAVRSR